MKEDVGYVTHCKIHGPVVTIVEAMLLNSVRRRRRSVLSTLTGSWNPARVIRIAWRRVTLDNSQAAKLERIPHALL